MSHWNHPDRALENETDEALEKAAEFVGLENNPLMLILYRLDHQDKQLESIRINMNGMGAKLYEHIAKSEEMQGALDDMVVIWRGSRVMGKIIMWFIGASASVAALWAAVKKWPV